MHGSCADECPAGCYEQPSPDFPDPAPADAAIQCGGETCAGVRVQNLGVAGFEPCCVGANPACGATEQCGLALTEQGSFSEPMLHITWSWTGLPSGCFGRRPRAQLDATCPSHVAKYVQNCPKYCVGCNDVIAAGCRLPAGGCGFDFSFAGIGCIDPQLVESNACR